MPPVTPNADHSKLAPLASRFVDVATMPWVPTRWPGIHLKVRMEDKDTGLLTALTKFDKGAVLPDHEHVELEQTYVLEGSLVDDDGAVGPGQYVWRPGGSRHMAHSPDGCIVLSFFLKPNKFFDVA
jgi:anti-sigma factor ChrR (cupin superfamily)